MPRDKRRIRDIFHDNQSLWALSFDHWQLQCPQNKGLFWRSRPLSIGDCAQRLWHLTVTRRLKNKKIGIGIWIKFYNHLIFLLNIHRSYERKLGFLFYTILLVYLPWILARNYFTHYLEFQILLQVRETYRAQLKFM